MRKNDHRLKGKKNPSKVKKNTPHVLTRKERRREQRKSIKIKKHEYFANKRRTPGLFVRAHENVPHVEKRNESSTDNEGDRAKKRFQKELQQTKVLKQEMKKSRDRQLIEANKEEDKVIKKLEKQLKLNKRKSKSIPKSFSSDGLDYLLEVCDSENLKDVMTSEQNVYDSCSDIDDDFTALFGKSDSDQLKNKHDNNNMSDENSDLIDFETDSQVSAEEPEVQDVNHICMHKDSNSSSNVETSFSKGWSVTDLQANDDNETKKKTKKRKLKSENENVPIVNKKKVKCKHGDKEISDSEESLLYDDDDDDDDDDEAAAGDAEVEEFWEDIYGRTRDKAGNIVQVATGKYVPPHMRLKNEAEDGKKQLLLLRLKKQMKGLLNRLSEGNMKSIATQVEQLYMSNSRHDMNKILSELLMESLVVSVRTPERLIMEHALLVAVLHSNVDTEVGIYFLQAAVKKFHELCNNIKDIEDKQLDNIVLIISHLYNFKH